MKKFRFGRPKIRRLDLHEIERWLPSIGFTAARTTQEWRHVVSFGAFEGKPSVLKLACTQETSRHTRNEKNWNEAIHLTDPEVHPHFTVPRVYADGIWNKLYYFVCDRYADKAIAGLKSFDESRVREWLPTVAKVNREVELLEFPKSCKFVKKRINSRSSKIPSDQKLILPSREWASLVPRDLSDLIGFLEKVGEVRTAPAHGDFVLRQMFELGPQMLGLIDGEHAGVRSTLHYDVAQMYIRLISDFNAWDLGHDYLVLFRQQLSKEDRDRFWEDLKPPLIQRFIGDLWGSHNNPKNLDRLMPLKDKILENAVV